MGFKRITMRTALPVALMIGATAAGAAPAPEPLIITKHSDSMLTLSQSGAPQPESAVDDAITRFGRAMGQAIQAQEQAVEAACKSVQRPKPGSAAVYTWGARCSYQRY